MPGKEIWANITITATYDRGITIRVQDKSSGISFLEMNLSKEQFVDAAMNRLCHTSVLKAEVRGLEKVGKTCQTEILEFPMPEESSYHSENVAIERAKSLCPAGWEPELYFKSQDSFFAKDDGTYWARTSIRRWV